ncbi:group III truncated hemoglobin [Azorhizobium doebereinerae]|uniref:group III truncated hemoglobin n=1 Tax=Azorhizobium doebereinerae TaxID=281091 RepID=UPI0004151B92|nr:group III truncated hemoglobin [Azorhizobium doebereinerae]
MKHARIDEPAIAELVERFYGYARADARLGPVFAAAVHDWPGHMATLKDFWSSVMLGSGRYKGNPFAVHTALPLEPGLFQDWLGLWHKTTAELFEPEVAAQFDARAERIADSLKAGLFFNPSRPAR